MSSFQGVLIRGVPAVLFIEVSSFQGVLIRGVPAVLCIEVSSFQGVLIRGVPAVLFIEVSSFQGVLIRGVPAVLFIEVSSFHPICCLSPMYSLLVSEVGPSSRTAGVGFSYTCIYICTRMYLTIYFGPGAARALRANITGLASSARYQCVAFN